MTENSGDIWYWAVEEPIIVTQLNDHAYQIRRVNGPEWFVLSFDYAAEPGKTMLFNGKFKDVGDDFMAYVSITDEYHSQGGEIGKAVKQEPFKEEE